MPANATLSSGAGSFSATLKTAGSQTLTATDTVNGFISGVSGTVAISPAAASQFVVGAPANALAGTRFTFTVTAKDAYNNTANGYAGTVRFTSSDSIAVLPANSTLSSGTGTFSATLKSSGNQSLIATDTVNSSISGSSSVSVTVSTATHFTVSIASSATAGGAVTFTVTAKDANNNTANGYTGTVHFTSSDAAAVLPANATLINGVGTFSVTLKTAGNQTITATDTVIGAHNRQQQRGQRQRGGSGTIHRQCPSKRHRGQRLLDHSHRTGHLQQHGYGLLRDGPLHQQRRGRGPAHEQHID